MKVHLVVLVCVLGCTLTACGSKKKAGPREAWPVGLTFVGACTYSAPDTVAMIGSGTTPTKLVGEGELVETCKGDKRTIDVVKPTAITIEGPDTVKVGETSAPARTYKLKVVGGTRVLTGISKSNSPPGWWLDSNCTGIANLETPPAPAGGGYQTDRALAPIAPGTCTVQAQLMQLTAQRVVGIK